MGFGRYKSFGRRGFGKPEPAVTVMAKRSSGKAASGGTLFGLDVRIEQDELTVSIGALSLCDYVSRALLEHTARAISDGQRPAGGSQVPLDSRGHQGREALAGKRPMARGNTGTAKAIPPNLTRSEVKGGGRIVTIGASPDFGRNGQGPKRAGTLGVSATADIYPMFAGQAKFIDEESALGVDYFAVDGIADRVIEDVVIDYLATVFDGERYYDPSKTTAKEQASGL
jgi:hypothetical protein